MTDPRPTGRPGVLDPEILTIDEERVREWVATVSGADVITFEAMSRASSTIVFCTVGPPPAARGLVCRIVVELDWIRREPHAAQREFEVCRYLSRLGWPVPLPLAADPDGHRVGSPAVISTRLPGQDAKPPYGAELLADAAAWLRRLHHLAPDLDHLPSLQAYYAHDLVPHPAKPEWLTSVSAAGWSVAVNAFRRPPPLGGALVHRDFRMGNLLTDPARAAITGIVDWTDAATGHPHADVGHFRANLALEGLHDEISEFTSSYLSGGQPYARIWDLYALVGMTDVLRPVSTGAARRAIERLILDALDEVSEPDGEPAS